MFEFTRVAVAVGILAASGDPVVPGGPLDFPNGLFHHDEPVPDAFSGDPVGPDVDAPGPEVDAPGPEVDAPGPEVDAPGPEADAPGPEVDAPGSGGALGFGILTFLQSNKFFDLSLYCPQFTNCEKDFLVIPSDPDF